MSRNLSRFIFQKTDAMITIEASVIYTWITLFVVGLIQLDMKLHDRTLSDICKVLGAMRYEQMDDFYYDSELEDISLKHLLSAPIIGEEADYRENQTKEINERVKEYYNGHCMKDENELSDTALKEVFGLQKSSNILRTGGKIVQLIGGIKNE